MLSLDRLRLTKDTIRISHLLNQTSPLILAGLVMFAIYNGYRLIQYSDGGTDLVNADIPKSLMFLHGQNPYSVQPWASPYPPFLLVTVSGIIRVAGLIQAQPSPSVLSEQIRIAGLLADSIVALTIYLSIRLKTRQALQALLPAGLFLTLPALSTSPLYFFHSDTLGYPILAGSLLALATQRYLIGTSLLATATIYKIHPVLALPLILIWLLRVKGLRATLASLASSTIILTVGLILPLAIPGYTESVLGFNLANDGNGNTMLATLNLFNTILPASLQYTATTLLANQVWIATTATLYTIIIGIVYTRAKRLGPIDVTLLGLLAWLIPLKIEYTHYVAWAIIPILMRGRLGQTLPLLGLLQVADSLAYWSWWPSTSPIPGLNTLYGLLLSSTMYRALGLTALAWILISLREKTLAHTDHDLAHEPSLSHPTLSL